MKHTKFYGDKKGLDFTKPKPDPMFLCDDTPEQHKPSKKKMTVIKFIAFIFSITIVLWIIAIITAAALVYAEQVVIVLGVIFGGFMVAHIWEGME